MLLGAVVVEVEAVALEDIVETEKVAFVVGVTTGVFDVDVVVVGDMVIVMIDFDDVTVEAVDTNNVVLAVLDIDSVVIFFDAVDVGFDVVIDDGDVVFKVEVVDIVVLVFA